MSMLRGLLSRSSPASWLFRSRLTSAAVLGPWAVWQRVGAFIAPSPPALPLLAIDSSAAAERAPSPRSSSLADVLLDGFLRMAVPKKRLSYTRKRKRIAGFQAMRGPKLQTHMYMCPVCERLRLPHRVCGREDCSTYFKHKWF